MTTEVKVTQADKKAMRSVQVDLLLAGTQGDKNAWRKAEEAFAKHRLAERARIAAWLAEQSYDIRPFGLLQGDHPSSVLTEAADRIERGDHDAAMREDR